ncbi:hypothetical protein Agub_g15055, partial [Astrephomene gubernaculifera]
GAASGLTVEERMQQVGLVFQFPERHFLGADIMQELSFTWPRLPQYWGERQALAARMQQVLEAVGLEGVPLDVPPWALSGGQQRRLALAIQLVRRPAALLLDEPLAGLDWQARREVVGLLGKIKVGCGGEGRRVPPRTVPVHAAGGVSRPGRDRTAGGLRLAHAGGGHLRAGGLAAP